MRIHHVALRTGDLPRLEAFYAGVLGLPVVRRAPGRVWLAATDDASALGALLMLEQREQGEPEVPVNYKEFLAFAIAASDRAARREALERANVAIEAETDFTLYFRDPDGRRVGLSHYVLDWP